MTSDYDHHDVEADSRKEDFPLAKSSLQKWINFGIRPYVGNPNFVKINNACARFAFKA